MLIPGGTGLGCGRRYLATVSTSPTPVRPCATATGWNWPLLKRRPAAVFRDLTERSESDAAGDSVPAPRVRVKPPLLFVLRSSACKRLSSACHRSAQRDVAALTCPLRCQDAACSLMAAPLRSPAPSLGALQIVGLGVRMRRLRSLTWIAPSLMAPCLSGDGKNSFADLAWLSAGFPALIVRRAVAPAVTCW